MNPPSVPPTPAAALPPRSTWEVQRAVLFALLLREMKARVGGQWVGAIWTLIEPLAHVLMILTIFTVLRGGNMPGVEVPVFLAVGLLPFFLYQHLATRLMEAITANRGLFAYRQLKPLDPLIARAGVEALMNLSVYVVTLGLLGWLGYHVLPQRPLEAIGIGVLVLLLGTGAGLLFAVAGHERPRVKAFARMLNMPMYLASGAIFPLAVLPPEALRWLLLNPMAHLVDLSRQAFLPGYTGVPGVSTAYPALFTLCLLALAMLMYRANRLRLVTTV